MKPFRMALLTLLWLELRKQAGWWMALGGVWALSLALIWRLHQEALVRATQGLERPPAGSGELLIAQLGVGGLAAFTGLLLLLLAPGRRETWLLLSDPPGFVHLLARFLFKGGALLLFLLALTGLLWWGSRPLGLQVGLGGLWGVALYGGMLGLPLLALALLGQTLVWAYTFTRLGWLAGAAAFMGTLALLGGLLDLSLRSAYAFLPPWPFPNLHLLGQDLLTDLSAKGLPTEPLLYALLVVLGALFLAGGIWDEVEV